MTGVLVVGLIGVAGGAGAALRFVVDQLVGARWGRRFPWGITVINITGSFALGVLTGLALDHPAAAIVSTGALGGFTTFSTASVDTVRALMAKRVSAALVSAVGTLVGAVGLALCGILLGATLR